jgi:hypothetical protein
MLISNSIIDRKFALLFRLQKYFNGLFSGVLELTQHLNVKFLIDHLIGLDRGWMEENALGINSAPELEFFIFFFSFFIQFSFSFVILFCVPLYKYC